MHPKKHAEQRKHAHQLHAREGELEHGAAPRVAHVHAVAGAHDIVREARRDALAPQLGA